MMALSIFSWCGVDPGEMDESAIVAKAKTLATKARLDPSRNKQWHGGAIAGEVAKDSIRVCGCSSGLSP